MQDEDITRYQGNGFQKTTPAVVPGIYGFDHISYQRWLTVMKDNCIIRRMILRIEKNDQYQ